ncbi:transmembrane transport protein [Kitasatospora purpeofusca]|uniref:transmembrane transport protein n=1 Tax=Kitasatospora purpeofusca TaxID=67352 RepID=UPI003F4AB3EF
MSERNVAAGGAGVPQGLERALAAEVSLAARVRNLAVGLAGGGAAALVAVLWATEPQPLPVRTRLAFAGLIAVGLAWAAFASWTLTRKRPLYARDRVLAGRIALAAASATAGAGTVLAVLRGTPVEVLVTAVTGLALVVAAGLALRRARVRHRELLRLRDALRQETP